MDYLVDVTIGASADEAEALGDAIVTAVEARGEATGGISYENGDLTLHLLVKDAKGPGYAAAHAEDVARWASFDAGGGLRLPVRLVVEEAPAQEEAATLAP